MVTFQGQLLSPSSLQALSTQLLNGITPFQVYSLTAEILAMVLFKVVEGNGRNVIWESRGHFRPEFVGTKEETKNVNIEKIIDDLVI